MNDYSKLAAANLGPRGNDVRLRAKNGFPLLFLGGACILVGMVLLQNNLQIHSVRVPIWLLSLSVGVVALMGGFTALVAGNFEGSRPATHAKPFTRGNEVEGRADEAAAARVKAEKIVVSRWAWDRLNELALQTVKGAGTSTVTARPISPNPATVSPTTRISSPDPTRPAKPAGRGDEVPESHRGIDEAISDLETLLEEKDRGRPKAGLPPRTNHSEVTSAVIRSGVPPKSFGSRSWDELNSRPKQGRPASGGADPAPEQPPPELPDELAELLSEFYPDIQTGSRSTESRAPSLSGRGMECPGCGRTIGETPGRVRCFRCTKPMCGNCSDRARGAKRTLLCKSCFEAYVVGYPEG